MGKKVEKEISWVIAYPKTCFRQIFCTKKQKFFYISSLQKDFFTNFGQVIFFPFERNAFFCILSLYFLIFIIYESTNKNFY
ncbi:hypothetical protein CSB09_00275 [Candidatus Gracilibacteria bacterium]|nr:MAG: hypothetical protein CSB09_00275 [Candidatus Gracilibacteria bacterium]